MLNNVEKGKLGEKIACNYLYNLNYIILNKNFRSRYGEIDIIAKDGDFIVFVEVKARTNTSFGLPCEAVNLHKQRKIQLMAQLYILKNNIECPVRFDVIEILFNGPNNKQFINHIKNAF